MNESHSGRNNSYCLEVETFLKRPLKSCTVLTPGTENVHTCIGERDLQFQDRKQTLLSFG